MTCPTCGASNETGASACAACGAPLAPDVSAVTQALPPGARLLGGAYAIGKVLGQGGFGITYLGSDTGLRRAVAIKELFPQGALRQGAAVFPAGGTSASEFDRARAQFLEEARLLARFQHRGIVHVYASFEENGTAYMVMELLQGRSLGSLSEERGALPEREAVGYIQQTGDALAAVHEANLLHRDIKPDNVILTPEGRVVLIDFGTAREFAAGMTRRMTTVLTPGYAPLEQYTQHARFGPFTDIYALGATLYHLLTGRQPIAATDRAVGVVLAPPHQVMPEISRAASDAVTWAMEMKVDARPQSVREFLAALRGQGAQTRPAPRPAASKRGFRFYHGEAATLEELADLCDRYPEETEDHLYSGSLERWLTSLGEPSLAKAARAAVATQRGKRRRGVELFLRELCRATRRDPYPRLSLEPGAIDLGELPVGARAMPRVRLKNSGRGHAWGTLTLEPALPGLKAPPEWDGAAAIDLELDTLQTPPGRYSGELVIQAEGLPSAVRIPLRYEVVPLQVTVEPDALDLGVIPHGTRAKGTIRLSTSPPGGRLSGSAALSPFVAGVELSPSFSGPAPAVTLTVASGALEAGRRYELETRLHTNAGHFQVPVRFRVAVPWAAIARQGVLGGAAVGLYAAALRAWIHMVTGPASAWILDFSAGEGVRWILTVGFLAPLALALFRGGVSPWRSCLALMLLATVLGCLLGPAKLLLTSLLLGLEYAALAWGRVGAMPELAWGINGALLGLLNGVATALARTGHFRARKIAFVVSVAMLVVLATVGVATHG
jgi:serine/threonine protein kinase